MYRDGMTVLADKMHTNVRLYISSTQVCLHSFCVSLVLATPLPELRYLAPYWMDAHMYRDGMTILADKMHTFVRLYISSTQVCLHYLCVSLVFATPFLE